MYELHTLTHKHIFKHISTWLIKKNYTETFLPHLQLACMKWGTIFRELGMGWKSYVYGVNMSVVSYLGKF